MDAYEKVPVGTNVTTGALARKLGISPTTLRSWDRRYGLGPAARTEGHHRRWSAEDVAMVEEMCHLTAQGVPPAEAARAAKDWAAKVRTATDVSSITIPHRLTAITEPPSDSPPTSPTTPSNPDWRRRSKGIARAALRMDAEAVHEQITAAIGSYGVMTAREEVITPTLLSIGRKWESSEDTYVEVEHLLSWHISAALRHTYARAVATNRPAEIRPILLAVPYSAVTAVVSLHARRTAHPPAGCAHRSSGGTGAARDHARQFGTS
ncbi:MerR family transcriptional regulator [Streptomyces sp. NPDC001914]|uniref:MerR family transcriptional regulator n=1 Tax=Streptomyces sp. NPDC001914 TaxID=3364623 RepID=UPI003678320A